MLEFLGIPSMWDRIVEFFTISPFWSYLFWGVVISFGAAALAWFFPVLRSLAGAIILAIAGGLFAYRKGETDAIRRERDRQARERQRQQRRQQQEDGPWNSTWRWPWS